MANVHLRRRHISRITAALATGAMLFGSMPVTAIGSTWDPTLLVNTESFQIIDDGDGTSPIYLQFGDSAAERLIWDVSSTQFLFTDDLTVQGNLSASGSLTINADQTGDAVATFGNGTGDQTITFSDSAQDFVFSTGATFNGALSGSSLTVSDLSNCEVVVTAADGTLQCASSNFLTDTEGDARYVNSGGDTMTGNLILTNSAGVSAQGNFATSGSLLINDDNTGDATISFGGSVVETLTFSETNGQFEFSDDVAVTGNITATGDITAAGALSGNTLTVSSGSVNINGVDYNFTNTQGTNGQVLTNDGNGNLTWANSTVGNGSGAFISLVPEYPNAIYEGDGSNNTGRLGLEESGTSNTYAWRTSRAADQDYDIIVRVKVPENFLSWDATALELQYQTGTASTAANSVAITVLDTTGASDYAPAAAASTSFATFAATSSDLNGTYTPGEFMTIRIKLLADSTSGAVARAGYLNINWETTTP